MNNTNIWTLLEAGETRELYANLDDAVIDRLAMLFFDVMEDEDDPDAPEDVSQVREMIVNDVINGDDHSGCFSFYELRRQELNRTIDGDFAIELPDATVTRGSVVYEAAKRIIMGCDMSYALEPIGYFTKRIDSPELTDVEWREIVLS